MFLPYVLLIMRGCIAQYTNRLSKEGGQLCYGTSAT